MKCENKELFWNYYILIPCWCPQYFNVPHGHKTKSRRGKFAVLLSLWDQSLGLISTFLFPSSVSQSLYLPPSLSFPLFSFTVTLKVSLLCLFRHTELSVSLSPPSLPLFSLASSVSLPRDSRVLRSRYRPIDFGRERKYCGHDSPCMNLMIPVLSVPSFQWRREEIIRTPFLSPSLQACQ